MILRTLGPTMSLLLIVVVLLVVLWRVRRIGTVKLGQERGELAPRVLARAPVGPKQGIALVKVGEHVLAVSFGDGGVRTLLELPPEESTRVLQQVASTSTKSFGESLENALERLNTRIGK